VRGPSFVPLVGCHLVFRINPFPVSEKEVKGDIDHSVIHPDSLELELLITNKLLFNSSVSECPSA
jgi:hypothetical protein